ncbi:MAG: hypothetical protein H0W74_07885 [Sphingosinicella sp.]|nr:hypothetical protein [Sphingosinicella sp.]
MATVAVIDEASAPISLYVELAPERRGDLEAISRAAIAWAETIREAAFLTDPFLDVRVELISGTEGSIDLNSQIRRIAGAAKDAVKDTLSDRKKLKAIAIAVALFFARDAYDWARGKGYDELWDWARDKYGEIIDTFSDEDRREVEEIAARVAASKSAREKAAKVYRELQRDDAVTGVGVSFVPGARPSDVVPRAQFGDRGGTLSVIEETIVRRTQVDRLTLTLVAPALSDMELKWKFLLGSKTVWAFMDDPDFKERLRPGSNSAPRMVTGIRMDVEIETVQEMRDGVWNNVEQRIKKVHGLSEPTLQPGWLDAPTKPPQT